MKFSFSFIKTKSVPMGRCFSDNCVFNFYKHKLSGISIMNSVCIKNDFAANSSDFLANKHYITFQWGEVLIHSFDVVHISQGSSGWHCRKHGAVSSQAHPPSFLYNV